MLLRSLALQRALAAPRATSHPNSMAKLHARRRQVCSATPEPRSGRRSPGLRRLGRRRKTEGQGSSLLADEPRLPKIDLEAVTPALAMARRRLALTGTHNQTVTTRIRGISFDGRQDNILVEGECLMFTRDPTNPYDPNAVRIEKMDGRHLGYVDRALTAGFPWEVCCGRAVHVGQAEPDAPWGARVVAQAQLPILTLDPLPPKLTEQAAQLPEQPGWQRLEAWVRQRCGYSSDEARRGVLRCEVTGAYERDLDAPLRVVPEWRYDYSNRRLRLVGGLAVCEPVWVAKQLDQLDAAERRAALALVQQVNDWLPAELDAYVGFVDGRRFAIREGFSVDFSEGLQLGATVR